MPAFKKNDDVVKIARWSGEGVFYIVRATVRSCGAKQMVLFRRGDESDCLGRNFRPQVAQYELDEVVLDIPAEQAEARALELSAAWIASETARYERILETGYGADSAGYTASMERHLARMRAAEPSFIWR